MHASVRTPTPVATSRLLGLALAILVLSLQIGVHAT
jgi:hypothetical protein